MSEKEMNIYARLQKARVDLQKKNLKKTGQNKYSGYDYFELGDFLPAVNEILFQNGLFSRVFFRKEYAYLAIHNIDNPKERILFSSPMAEATLKGCHPIQNIGAVQTYQRRYLYMLALEIVEHDIIDATTGAENTTQATTATTATKRATENQLKAIYEAAKDRDPMQIREILRERYGVEKSIGLTQEQAYDFLEYLNKKEG